MSKRTPIVKSLALLVALAMCLTLMPANIGISVSEKGHDFYANMEIDAKSHATSSSSGGGSSSGGSDAVSGATSSSSSSSGNTAVDSSNYDMSKYAVSGSMTGPQLAAVIDNTPLFYKNGSSYTQLMYKIVSNYAYYFYLSGGSYSNYAAMGYGYSEPISISNSTVMNNLYAGTLKTSGSGSGSGAGSGNSGAANTYTGTAEVGDEEGSKLALIVSVADGKVTALTADDANCVGTWGTLLSKRESEYVGQSVDSMDYDAVTSATIYSAAVKTAVQDALGHSSSSSKKASIGLDKSSVYVTAGNTASVYVTGTGCTVSASSSSSSIASIELNGNTATITAKKAGTATITFSGSASSGYEAPDDVTCKVTVEAAADESGSSTPQIMADSASSWTKGNSGKFRVRSSSALANFIAFLIDGKVVDEKYHEKSSGSTIIDVSDEYMNNLDEGDHEFVIASKDGNATGKFTVVAASTPTTSGDSSSSPSGTYTGTAVTSLTDGDYLIVDSYTSGSWYSSGGETYYVAMTASEGGNGNSGYYLKAVDVDSYSDGTATVTDNTGSVVWTYNSNTKSFYNASSGKYLALPSGSSSMLSSSAMSLTPFEVSGIEMTVYNPDGRYYLNMSYLSGYSDPARFKSNYANYINNSYINSGVYFCKLDSSGGGGGITTQDDSSIILSSSTASVEAGRTTTIAAQMEGCTISGATSSDNNVATASYSNGVITIAGVATGNAAITVYGAGNSGYNDPESQTINLTVTETSDPEHVKTYDDSSESIKLNVTGKDITTTTTTSTPGQTVTKGTNLVLCIDTSGSIVGKESAINSAIQSLVNGLPDNSQVGVVTFDNSAQTGTIYTKSTIGGLAFSGNENASTYITDGLQEAYRLLAQGNWSNTSNDTAIVLISDGQASDPTNTVTYAKTIKNNGVTIYTIDIDVDTPYVPEPSTGLDGENRWMTEANTVDQGMMIMQAVSSNYKYATTQSVSFMYTTVDYGTQTGTSYVYGAAGDNWSEIFSEIKEQQGMSETIVFSTAHMKGIEINDTLSEYVELSNTSADDNYGITITTSDSSTAPTFTASYDSSSRLVTITFTSDFELTDSVIYTASIPVKATSKAQQDANDAQTASVDLPTNENAKLTYQYGDNDSSTVDYEETPTIRLTKQVTLTYDANADKDNENVTGMPKADIQNVDATSQKAPFTISSSEPVREGYTFVGWNTDKNATKAEEGFEKGNTVELDKDTTLYAVWTANAATVTWMNGTVKLGEQTVNIGQTPEYDGESEPTKEDDEQYSYTFAGWATTDNAEEALETLPQVTGDITYYAVYTKEQTAFQVIFEDYTVKTNGTGGATIGGIEGLADIDGHANCKIGTHYYRDSVTFTLTADLATVAAIHTDNSGMSYDKLKDQNGSYQRLYCENVGDKTYQFTVPVTDSDVYIVIAYKGDISLDARLLTSDASSAAMAVTGKETLTNLGKLVGDVDHNGRNLTSDASECAMAVTGKTHHSWDTDK